MSTTTFSTPSHSATQTAVSGAWRATIGAIQRVALSYLRSRHRRAPAAQRGSPAQEANNVRAMAFAQMKTDPGFAADLFAAADRHEQLHGAA